jgi:TPR repeat protein
LLEGCNGKLNISEAMKYFKMAADLGESGGMFNYGFALQEGFNGKIDLSEAMKYFKMAADLGEPKGMFN